MQAAEILGEDDNPRKEAALALLDRGFHVFAVKAQEKRPDPLLAPSGFLDATTDAETVAGWWDAKPKASIGIACGAAFGVVVIDVDVKNDAPGMKTYAELGLGAYATLTARTPSGGYHLYFRHPKVKLKATLPGIDIKGAAGGGYVVAPPSTLPNGAYAWLDPDMPAIEMPSELLAELAADAGTAPAKSRDCKASPVDELKTGAGGRHNRLKELAGAYRGKGLEADEIEALLWWHAERFFDPPFSRESADDVREVEQLAHWVGRKPAGEAPDSPLVVLTTAELVARAAETPPANLVDPVLPTAGNLMIHGTSGVGKSHLGLCVALAASNGSALLEWSVAAPVSVLLVDGEMPLHELKARLDSYLHGTPAPERLYWIAARAAEGDLPDLADPAAQERYTEAILECGARLVVFDNLSCLRATSADSPENSVESWHPVASFIRRLNGLGVAVVLVHHSAKSGTQRGSSAHVAVFDTVIAVRALGEGQADPLAENDVELVFEKHRRFGGEAARTIRAQAFGDADGFVTWRSAGADPLVDDVVRLHRSGHSIRDMAEILKRSKAGIEKAVSRAKAAGKWPLGESA